MGVIYHGFFEPTTISGFPHPVSIQIYWSTQHNWLTNVIHTNAPWGSPLEFAGRWLTWWVDLPFSNQTGKCGNVRQKQMFFWCEIIEDLRLVGLNTGCHIIYIHIHIYIYIYTYIYYVYLQDLVAATRLCPGQVDACHQGQHIPKAGQDAIPHCGKEISMIIHIWFGYLFHALSCRCLVYGF